MGNRLELTTCTIDDFHYILEHLEDFWGSQRTENLHHPMFVYELGDTALAVKHESRLVGYLWGLIAQKGNVGYCHLMAIHRDMQRQGLGRLLYEAFFDLSISRGCKHIKAITTLANAASISFHRRLGFETRGDSATGDVHFVKNYSGAGQDRIVFWRDL